MKIEGLSSQNHSFTVSNGTSAKNDSDSEMFKQAIMDFEKQIQKRINKDLENDQKNNICMSDKKWQCLMNRVDCAISTFKKTQEMKENLAEKDRTKLEIDNTRQNQDLGK